MESRKALQPGTELTIQVGEENKRFRIEGLVKDGDKGSSCLVYKCQYLYKDDKGEDTSRPMILKEFYPLGVAAKRGEKGLEFLNEKEDARFRRLSECFYNGYLQLKEFASKESTVNNCVHLELDGLAKDTHDNGTMYILQEWNHGSAFNLEESSLQETIRVLKMTVSALAAYHEMGYLHLDVKEANILYLRDAGYLKLFDCDSVMKKTDIQKGYPLRSTPEYAAPELRRVLDNGYMPGYAARIDETTDRYFIGAILYKKVTGAHVNEKKDELAWKDSIEDYYRAIEDAEILSGLDPMIKKELAKFFSKTLNYRMSNRYSTAQDTIDALEEIERLADPYRMYMVGSDFNPGEIFIGRETELEQMKELLEDKKEKSIVLSGMGGIGKSVLSRKYAEQYKDEYNLIITCDFKGNDEKIGEKRNLKELISDIYDKNVLIQDRKSDDLFGMLGKDKVDREEKRSLPIKEKHKVIKELCDGKKVLLIVDNFDSAGVLNDPYAADFISTGWQIVFTSRLNLKGNGYGSVIEVNSLKELEEMFMLYYRKNCPERVFSPEEEEALRDLLEVTGRHTITAELLAKKISSEECETPDEKERLIKEELEMVRKGVEKQDYLKISYIRDENSNEKSVYAALHSIFDISRAQENGTIDEMELEVLRNLTLLSMDVSEKTLLEMMGLGGSKFKGIVKGLTKKGWVKEKKVWRGIDQVMHYEIHPVIADVICHELEFDMQNCGAMVEYMLDDMEDMKRSFVFKNTSGKLLFTEKALEWLNCDNATKVRLYDCNGVMNGEEGRGEEAKESFEAERKLLEKMGELTEEKSAILDVQPLFYKQEVSAAEVKKIECVANKYNYGSALCCVANWNIRNANTENASQIYEWSIKAAQQGNALGQLLAGVYCLIMKKNGKGAFEWMLKAAEQGHTTAQCNVAIQYEMGFGVLKSDEEAFKWGLRAAKQGDAKGQCYVAECYRVGRGVKKNSENAYKWYLTAAEQGNAKGMYFVGCCYEYGRGVPVNENKAFEWYSEAAERENTYAQYKVGICYYLGKGVKKSAEKAFEWWIKAAEKEYPKAQYNVGACYDKGEGVEQNLEKAYEYYTKSANQGCEEAIEALKQLKNL